VVTKSGSNAFHGSLFEYLRNDALDAPNFFDNIIGQKAPLRLNQFGGSIGGPIVSNKAFFFFSYEGYRQVLPAGVVTSVPTPDMLPDSSGNVNLTNYLAAVNKTNGIYDPDTTTCSTSTHRPGRRICLSL